MDNEGCAEIRACSHDEKEGAISPRHGDPLALQMQREVQRARSSFWLCRQQSLARLRARFHSLKKLIRCTREKGGILERKFHQFSLLYELKSRLGSRAFCSASNNITTGLSGDDWCCCYCQILDENILRKGGRWNVGRWNEEKREGDDWEESLNR